jgi:hypothetical protein
MSIDESRAAHPAPAANVAAEPPASAQLAALLEELRIALDPFIVNTSDQRHIISELERVACALKVAVVGSAAVPQNELTLMTAQDALSLLCDPEKVGALWQCNTLWPQTISTFKSEFPDSIYSQNAAYMEFLDTPQGFEVRLSLRSRAAC